ncbi:hypothetical protein FRC17_005882, partial [Serendipita sp. 399]
MKAEIDDLFLLVNPAASSQYDPVDDEKRAQAAKQERLRTAETLQIQEQAQVNEESLKNQGFIDTIIAKIINNFQVTVKNIHVRYEDNVSVPDHPFAAGITLSGFTITSVNEKWEKGFVPSTAGAIHKLAELHSFAIYFNTDAESIRGLPPQQSADKFRSLVEYHFGIDENPVNDHQFILRPITMNHTLDDKTPKFDVELDFEEIGFLLDNYQYRDVISMIDMYHFFLRNQQYRKIRPTEDHIAKMGKSKALWKFAREAVVGQVHEKHREWSWAHFAERRDDRRKYVRLYKQKLPGALKGPELKELDDLETKLSYEDLRFYRSIARAELRKDIQVRRKLEEEKRKEQEAKGGGGWFGWIRGTSHQASTDEILGVQMNDQRRKELFDALEYDEKAATAAAFEPPKNSLKARIKARLQKGSLALRSGPTQSSTEVMSIVFHDVRAKAIQRPTSLDALVSLGDLHVYDSTTPHSQYPEIVKIKSDDTPTVASIVHLPAMDEDESPNSLLMVKFEQSPLDERADNGLTVKLRPLEVVYHRGFVEALYNYFKPPETQMESVAALLDVASETLEGFRNATRAGLEHALQAHKTIDVQMDLQAPIIIVPEDVTNKSSVHLIIDAGHLAIGSDLVPKKDVQEIYSKRNQQYTEEDYRRLEALMYDRFSVKLSAAQFVLGNGLEACLNALKAEDEHGLHLLEKTNVEFSLHNSIVPTAVQLSKIK